MTPPTWFIRNPQGRNDIIANATLAANNSGQAQRVLMVWRDDDPDHDRQTAIMYDAQWWVVDCMIEPDPSYPVTVG